MAEIIILIVFCLLLALTATLAKREETIRELQARIQQQNSLVANSDIATRLQDALQQQFPGAKTFDDYFKELVALRESAERLARLEAEAGGRESLVQDARIGALIREAAEDAGASNVEAYAKILVALSKSQAEVAEKLAQAEAILATEHTAKNTDLPPIINLSEADGNFFAAGSAELTKEFRNKIQTEVADSLVALIDRYDVNVVEVLGHTDEQRMGRRESSSLDTQLIPAVNGTVGIEALRPNDNAGLGMARAVAVLKVLRADPRLANVSILPLSAAQMIAPIDKLADGRATGDIPERRRIEIRVRRSTTKAEKP